MDDLDAVMSDENAPTSEAEVMSDVEVISEAVKTKSHANTVVRRLDAEEGEAITAFEKAQLPPAIAGDDGDKVPFDPRQHVAFVPSAELHKKLESFIGKDLSLVREHLQMMQEKDEISEVRIARITEPLSADPVMRRVTVIVNSDQTVNSVSME